MPGRTFQAHHLRGVSPPWIRNITETVELTKPAVAAEKYFFKSAIDLAFEFGAASHAGLCRAENQDHYAVVRRRRTQELLLSNVPKARACTSAG